MKFFRSKSRSPNTKHSKSLLKFLKTALKCKTMLVAEYKYTLKLLIVYSCCFTYGGNLENRYFLHNFYNFFKNTTMKTETIVLCKYIFQNIFQDFYSKTNPNEFKDKLLCLGNFETMASNPDGDVINRIASYLESVRIRYKSDPFWMIEPGTIGSSHAYISYSS